MMKKFLVLASLILCCSFAKGQVGIRVFMETPLGDTPEIFDTSIGGEFFVAVPIDKNERFIARGGFTGMSRNFKFDSYPDYLVLIDRNNALAVESDITLESYEEGFLSVGGHVNAINRDQIKVFAGADVLIGQYLFRYNSYFDQMNQGSKSEKGNVFGYRIRAGVSYNPTPPLQLVLESHWGKRRAASLEESPHFDVGLGVLYYFNK